MVTSRKLVNLALAALAFLAPHVSSSELGKYLIISAPALPKVVYLKIGDETTTKPLIESGLRSPQGLAVNQKRKILYVADPDSRKVFGYNLLFNNGVLMTDGRQQVAVQNVDSRWVAVDGVGNIFITNEPDNLVQRVSAEKLLRGDPTPKTLYNGISISQVSGPGGIAVDNFHIFWSNKIAGNQVGSVIKGYENPPETNVAASVKAISKNAVKIYGVCLVDNNVFYTDSETYVYGVKKTGGAIATITDKLIQPRGLAWDGDGTVYIADRKGQAVYSFPGNMQTLAPARLTKTVDFEDAFGLAVISGSRHAAAACGAMALTLVAWVLG